jgi:ribosomal protein S18 acetylase RimI-like enzyme
MPTIASLKAPSFTLKIRSAERKDLAALESVINQHWKVNANHEQELKNTNAIFLVAETGADEQESPAIVGTALLWATEWNKTGYLAELAVSKEHQRTGCGSKLMDELAKMAKERGLRAIIAETQMDNKVAMDFYLKRGLRLCGYNDRYYTNTPRSTHDIAVFFALDL